jgi:ferric-dicitrate binding protein FerR (iron transport regulator)
VIINNNHNETDLPVKDMDKTSSHLGGGIILLPLSYTKDSMVIETAWAKNRFEIVNETFGEIKNKIERWYNVKIFFKDEEVTQYPFTASFENESIEQVLKALQYAYYFSYTKNGNEITISK